MKIKDFKRIEFTFIDLLGDTSWAEESEFRKMECSTCPGVGYLFHKDNKVVMTFASYDADKEGNILAYGDRNIIPTSCITKIKYI